MRPAAAARGWRQKYLLTALGVVFALSALMRLGSLDIALAQGAPDTTPDLVEATRPELPEPHATGIIASLEAAFAEVEALRRDLETREAALIDRERAVATAQTLVEERLAELAAAETRLQALIALSDGAAETDLEQLTRVYESMPTEEAAALFEQMDPTFAAGFLSRMSPAVSAALMAELSPEAAYAVSFIIATRNTSAPVLATPDTEN